MTKVEQLEAEVKELKDKVTTLEAINNVQVKLCEELKLNIEWLDKNMDLVVSKLKQQGIHV